MKTLGTVRHNKKGQVGVSKETDNVTFSRSDLAQYLIDQARRRGGWGLGVWVVVFGVLGWL